jgi:hypothetical protein
MHNLDRRQFFSLAAGGTAAVMLPLIGCEDQLTKHKKVTAERANIIFIMADDLGYGDLGCYGQKEIKTPNIDQLADEGTRFTQCYAGYTVCAPSRSVLMTGQHTGHTRIRGNFGKVGGTLVLDNGSPQRRVPLEPQDVTVAEVLKQAGYVTGITGKWGLGEPGNTGVPNRQGFDEWFGYLNQRRAHTYYPPYLWHNEKKLILEGNANGRQEQYSHDMCTPTTCLPILPSILFAATRTSRSSCICRIPSRTQNTKSQAQNLTPTSPGPPMQRCTRQ